MDARKSKLICRTKHIGRLNRERTCECKLVTRAVSCIENSPVYADVPLKIIAQCRLFTFTHEQLLLVARGCNQRSQSQNENEPRDRKRLLGLKYF